MKYMNLAVIVSSMMLLVSGMAVAEGSYNHQINNHNFMSKRPYQAAPQEKAYSADDQWQGATLVTKEEVDENGTVITKQSKFRELRLHSLGRRPHMQ